MREQSRIQEKPPAATGAAPACRRLSPPLAPLAGPGRSWAFSCWSSSWSVGVLIYVQTPGGSARVLAFGLRAANEALAGKLTAGSLEIQGGHIVLRDVTLETPEGEKVAHVDLLEVRVGAAPADPARRCTSRWSASSTPSCGSPSTTTGSNLNRAIAARNPKPPEPSSGPLPFTFVVDSFTLDRGAVRLVQGHGKEATGGGPHRTRAPCRRAIRRAHRRVRRPAGGSRRGVRPGEGPAAALRARNG